MKSSTIIYTFSFAHHGKYSSIPRVAAYLTNATVIDSTLRIPAWLHGGLSAHISHQWQKYSEYRLLGYYCSPARRVFHYLYPENSLFQGWKWKGAHRLVLTCHQPASGLEQMKKQEMKYAGFFQGLKFADAVVVLSDTELQAYQKLAPQAKLLSIPLGVDTEYFKPDEKISREPIILTIGNWLRDYECWAKVARSMLASSSDFRFVVVANEKNIGEAKAALSITSGRVQYLSGISDEVLRCLYQRSSLMFLPLKDAVANNSLLEAMAAGLPVIATDLPATRQYIGEAGVLVSGLHPDVNTQAVINLMDNPELLTELGRAARCRAELVYSWRVIAAHYQSLYLELSL